MRQCRQGDVFLRKVQSVPVKAKRQHPAGRIVLALGEVTGHAHAIHELDNVDVFVTAEGVMYLKVKAPVSLTHEEHGVIVVPPGTYERVTQREYTPGAFRNVSD